MTEPQDMYKTATLRILGTLGLRATTRSPHPLISPLGGHARVVGHQNVRKLFVAVTLLVSTSLHAQIYTWRDNDDRLNITETPPPRSCQTPDCKKVHAVLDEAKRAHELELRQAVEKADSERRRQLEVIREQEAAKAREDLVDRATAAELVVAYKTGYAYGSKYKSEAGPYASGKNCNTYVAGGDGNGLSRDQRLWKARWDKVWGEGCSDAFSYRSSRYK